jgi:hypothetical protein
MTTAHAPLAPLTAFTTGYEIGRLWIGIVAIVAGAVAIGFGIWLVRRGRRPAADVMAPDDAPGPDAPVDAAAPDAPVDAAGPDAPVDAAAWAPPSEVLPTAPAGSSGRRAGGIALLVGGVVLMAAGLFRTIPTLSDDLSHHTVTLPQTAGSLTKVEPSAQMQQLLSSVPNQLGSFGEISNVQAGAYAESGSTDPVAYLIVAEIAGAPNPDEYFKGAASAFEQSNSGITLKEVDTAGMPGQMRCADLPTSVGICLWLDSDTLGVVIRAPGASQSSTDISNTLRAAAES